MATKTLPMGGTARHKKCVFDSFHGRDLLIWLKDLALELDDMKSSHHRLWNQMLKVRKLMNINDDKSDQKRKFEHYMDDGKSTCTFELINKEKYGNQVAKNHRRGEASSPTRLPVSIEKCSFQGMQVHVAFHVTNDIVEYCNSCWQDYSHLSNSNESSQEIKGQVFHATDDKEEDSNFCCKDYSHLGDSDESMPGPTKQGNLKSHFETFEDQSSYTIETTIKEKPNTKLFEELKSLVNDDFDDSSSRNSYSLSSGKEDWEIGPPLPFRGNHCLKLVIPIGPRFQAKIPRCEDLTNTRRYNIDDDFKWFGNEIWPMPDIMETNTKGVGNDRPDVCSCYFPGSIDCVQLHISEARELLQLEIGTTFSSWKFDEMGEDVSKSWTVDEQKEFELLTILNSQSNDMDFWKAAVENFPSKPLKRMINYYYNVCIPRRMSMKTRASFGAVDSDDDNLVGYEKEDDNLSTRMQIVPICKLRKSKSTNYL